MTPFQFRHRRGAEVNRWPTTGWKSFVISHSSISWPSVSARQIFSGGCGISRSMTRVRVGAMFSRLTSGISHLSIPSFQQVFELIKSVAPEGAVDGHPVDQGARACGVRCSGFRVPRGDAAPALPASAPRCFETAGCDTPHTASVHGRSVRPAASAPRKWPCASDRQGSSTNTLVSLICMANPFRIAQWRNLKI
jgi:hypothetical protein